MDSAPKKAHSGFIERPCPACEIAAVIRLGADGCEHDRRTIQPKLLQQAADVRYDRLTDPSEVTGAYTGRHFFEDIREWERRLCEVALHIDCLLYTSPSPRDS